MAFVGKVNTDMDGLGFASVMFHLKGAMLENGWELMSAGGGAGSGNYTAPNNDGTPISDFLTTVGSLNVSGAWFRIREPEHTAPSEARREFVFMRGSDNNRILIKYSRSSGFTTGGAEATCPTTGASGDGVVVSDSSSADSTATGSGSATLFSNVTTSRYLQIVLNDENNYGSNGCFPFWVWCYRASTGAPDWAMVHENVTSGTTSSLDADPTYQVCTGSLAEFMSATGVRGGWWEAYGLTTETRRRSENVRFCHLVHALVWSASVQRFSPPATPLGLSPYEGQIIFYPIMVGLPGLFFKGYSSGVTSSGFTQQNILDVFKINTANPRILVYHDPGNRISIFFPWLPGELPII